MFSFIYAFADDISLEPFTTICVSYMLHSVKFLIYLVLIIRPILTTKVG